MKSSRELVRWNLIRLRTAQGLSQERLAADAGVGKAYIGEVERAEKAATVDVLDKLAAVLDVPVGEFLRMPADGDEPPRILKGGRPRGSRPR